MLPPGQVHPTPLQSFWRALSQVDPKRINFPMGLRNALGVALPLAVAVALGHPGSGLVAATGALNVAAADGVDAYRNRARRMLASSALGAAAVLIGALPGRHDMVAVALRTLWAFAAGLMVSLGAAVADIATISLVVLIIYGSQSLTPVDALWAGLIALGGGLLQTTFSIALWPIRGLEPERRIIGEFYRELARAATAPPDPLQPAIATLQSTAAYEALSSLWGDHRVEAERHIMLVSQAERIRISLFALGRSRVRLGRLEGGARVTDSIGRFLELVSGVLSLVSRCLDGEPLSGPASECPEEMDRIVEAVHQFEDAPHHSVFEPHLSEARHLMDALAGQLRSALELAGHATPTGETAFAEREARTPWRLQLSGWIATLRANLSLDSSACRHAIRLAICIVIGEIVARYFSLPRSYWLGMTIALVLKPDFGNTMSRGVLRLAGTYTGLMLATVLFHFVPPAVPFRVLGVGILVFILRSLGLANYGILVTAISALIVFLFSLAGIAPKDVISARALNTTIGGTLALAIYWIWPTRERTQVPQALAGMLEAYRLYFQGVSSAYANGRSIEHRELDRLRISARRARSNVETSVDRLAAEPYVDPEQLQIINTILASSRRFIHAVLAVDAGAVDAEKIPGPSETARQAFQAFSYDLEKVLFFLAARLRGSPVTPRTLPNLREDHARLIRSADHPDRHTLLNIETDRMTNSLNTLTEQVFRWVDASDQGFPANLSRTA